MKIDRKKKVKIGCFFVALILSAYFIFIVGAASLIILSSNTKEETINRSEIELKGTVRNIKKLEGADVIIDIDLLESNMDFYDNRCELDNKNYLGVIKEKEASFIFNDINEVKLNDTVVLENDYWEVNGNFRTRARSLLNVTLIYQRLINPYFEKRYGEPNCDDVEKDDKNKQ